MPDLLSLIPRGEGYLVDQLKRALASALLNLAEGNGRSSTKDRNRFFDFSLGSIKESIAAIEYASALNSINLELVQNLIANLEHAYNMIRKLKK